VKRRFLIVIVPMMIVYLLIPLALSAEFSASKTSDRYHFPNCKWAKKIKPAKLLKFQTPEDAIKAGYKPCTVCKPPTAATSESQVPLQISGSSPVEQAERSTTFTLGLDVPLDHPWTIAHETLAKLISERTKGNLVIKVFPNRQLGGPVELGDAVTSGKIEMATLSVNVVSNAARPMEIVTLPFLFRDIDHAQEILSGAFGEKLLKEGDKYGFSGLGFFPSEFNMILNGKWPITKLEDFKGLQIRTIGKPLQIATYKSLGSLPVTLPFADLFEALNRKVIDGAEIPPSFLHSTKLHETTKYVTVIPISYSPGVVIMNSKKWNSLSSDLQRAIKDSIHEVSEGLIVDLKKREAAAIKDIKESGKDVGYVSDLSPFKNACRPVFEIATKEFGSELTKGAYAISYEPFK
jgi:TRAP-type transport system periplasmic protein